MMSDVHYDLGSYHPLSEARTLYSGSIDGEPSFYNGNNNSRTSTQSAIRSRQVRGEHTTTPTSIKSTVSPSSRSKLHSSSTTASPTKRQQQPASRSSNPTTTTTSSSSKRNNVNKDKVSSRSTSKINSNLRQSQQRAASMYYMDTKNNTPHHSTTSNTPATRDHRQDHTMDSRAYSDGRNDELFLTWRLDPEESLSDWTIIVRSIGTGGAGGVAAAGGGGTSSSNDDHDDTFSQDSTDNSNAAYNMRYYYVHKAQLGVGPRRSEYFARLFRSKRTTATTTSSTTTKHSTGKTSFDRSSTFEEKESRIELKPSAAAAFPLMLDYIYSPPGIPVRVTTESAVALRHLATCFGIRDLFSEVTAFIHHDLNLDTSFTYLREASIYNHEKLLSAAVKLCATKFEALKISQLVNLEPRLFQSIVTSPNCNCDSEILSSRVATYLRCRPGSYNWNFVKSITSPSKMPRIASDDSIFLISVLAQLGAIPSKISGKNNKRRSAATEEEDDDDYDDNNDDEEESVENDKEEEEEEGQREGQPQIIGRPTLYERCAASAVDAVRRAVTGITITPAIVSSKNSIKRTNSSSTNAALRSIAVDYQSLPTNVKVDLLERSLLHQQLQPSAEKRMMNGISTPSKLTNTMADGADNMSAVEDLKQQLKRVYVRKLEKYKSMLEKKREEIQAYEEELSKFQRVPITHRIPPLLTHYTYKEKPEYDRYGQSVYGDDPPTALPRIGEYEMDGWILKEDQWAENGVLSTRNWPMFFYKAN